MFIMGGPCLRIVPGICVFVKFFTREVLHSTILLPMSVQRMERRGMSTASGATHGPQNLGQTHILLARASHLSLTD
jgi:hypothetical protein